MTETPDKIPPLQLYPWPDSTSEGKGWAKNRLLGWFNGKVLYWERDVDELSIWATKLRYFSRMTWLTMLGLFGVYGLLLGAWQLFDIIDIGFSIKAIWEAREPRLLFFWASVIVDLYLYYAVKSEAQKKRLIRRVKPASQQLLKTDFEEILKVPRKEWIEISQYLTAESLQLVEQSVNASSTLKHQLVEPIHLMEVIAKHKNVRLVFARLGVSPKLLSEMIDRSLKIKVQGYRVTPALSQSYHQLLLGAFEEAYLRRSENIEVTDLFIAIMKTGKTAQAILYDLDVEIDELRNVVTWINIQTILRKRFRRYRSKARFKPKGNMNRSMTAVATPFLDRFSSDLTQLAKAGMMTFCVNREAELESIYRAVESDSNGVVLVGNPGVGRKTIIAGLAERMVSEDVPPVFRDKRLVSLSMSALIAGAKAPGALEERLLNIVAEVMRSGNIVLFIEDIHNMIGINTERGEGLDLSEVLDEFLKKRSFIVIASSNPLDYRRYVENGSLGESLHRIPVSEMDENQTTLVLEAKSSEIEFQQDVYFSYESIAAMVKYAKRYMHERFFPEKAIQLMEEVGAFVRRTHGKKQIVTAEDVAQIVSVKVKMPITKISEKEGAKLMNLETRIHERLVGQSEAVKMVSEALRRARAELRDLKRPIANLMFLGPTGVGKTELSKTVAEVYFGSEEAMIRIDMSEYQEQKSIDRLIGAPPGMTRGDEGGYLTEAVRRTPFSLLLLDEIEKAHPDILNLFLQVMDDGRLTDSLGRTIDFTNVVLIATSNAGTPLIQKRVREKVPIKKIRDELINTELAKHFRPEFLNRFDGIMVFKPLEPKELFEIAELLLNKVARRLDSKGIVLKATHEAVEELVQEGYDPAFGARPLRRVIQNKVDNALANYLLTGKLTRRDVAILEPGGVIRVEKAERL
ncbi:ATP-dependent Clp protease ATP-binding subunit [Patescibacteria group bacterium]|nr:ATP-dependent Clp protease ATP-binding subunit [Patescibacteria group bacterium]